MAQYLLAVRYGDQKFPPIDELLAASAAGQL